MSDGNVQEFLNIIVQLKQCREGFKQELIMPIINIHLHWRDRYDIDR